jgi:hypothetical protein
MKYQNINNSTKEGILDLMNSDLSLNYNALVELENRAIEMGVNPSEKLLQKLKDENSKIRDLSYLKNFGFKSVGSIDSGVFEIRRSGTGRLIDIVALFIGVLLMFVLPESYNQLLILINEGPDFSVIVALILAILLGFLGLMLVIRAINRILDYWGLTIIKNPNGVIIRKSGKEYVESQLNSEYFNIVSNEEYTVLNYELNGEQIPLIQTRGGIKQKLTIEHLKHLLSS